MSQSEMEGADGDRTEWDTVFFANTVWMCVHKVLRKTSAEKKQVNVHL